MSHLTANPFQKHYEFPSHRPNPLLTPPDTETEYVPQLTSTSAGIQAPAVPLSSILPGGQSIGLGVDLDSSPSYRSSPAPEHTLRKVSSIGYINSGPREARERVMQRGVRWLVVVVPPASLAQEHGQLGHTLAVGSADRLSQGILMPLCSTVRLALFHHSQMMPPDAI
jgi:hypothetical protein